MDWSIAVTVKLERNSSRQRKKWTLQQDNSTSKAVEVGKWPFPGILISVYGCYHTIPTHEIG